MAEVEDLLTKYILKETHEKHANMLEIKLADIERDLSDALQVGRKAAEDVYLLEKEMQRVQEVMEGFAYKTEVDKLLTGYTTKEDHQLLEDSLECYTLVNNFNAFKADVAQREVENRNYLFNNYYTRIDVDTSIKELEEFCKREFLTIFSFDYFQKDLEKRLLDEKTSLARLT